MSDKQIQEWVELAMKHEDITDYAITVHGTSNKDDGYLGNIAFVEVAGKSKLGVKKSYSLVIKSSKESNKLRQQFPVKAAFEKEIYIYDRVKTVFDRFQQEKEVNTLLDFLPHCYGSRATGTSELLILENLKPKGYDVWDRKIPMTYDHIKLILEAYGKWHALSLALKKEKPEDFEKLVENNRNIFSYFVSKGQMADIILEIIETARNNRILPHEILENLQFSIDDIKHIFSDLYDEDSDHQVILHGDGWTNNFLFQYQDSAKNPLNVRVIDWQCSGLASPVFDLSYFIYMCCDTEKYQDVKELLKIYYTSLEGSLKLLGIDAQDVFPYDKLLEHWKRFSRYGLAISAFILKFSLCDSDEAPDFAEAAELGKAFVDNLKFDIKDEETYFKRLTDDFIHYAKNL